jgi:hypothetical protein
VSSPQYGFSSRQTPILVEVIRRRAFEPFSQYTKRLRIILGLDAHCSFVTLYNVCVHMLVLRIIVHYDSFLLLRRLEPYEAYLFVDCQFAHN